LTLLVPAAAPACTPSKWMLRFAHNSVSTGLPANTPIEPVMVPGCATILVAGAATK
jgi:hypothetical protein